MKKHNTSKVVLITMLVFLLLSWILPAAYYSGEYIDQGRVQMGLFDLFSYPLTSWSYFGYLALFIILVGGFYGILYKIPAYRTFLEKIVAGVRGLEKLALSIMVVVLAVLVSFCGVQVAIILFLPFIVSLILLMGYDKIVAAMVTVGSICAGLIGSTFATSNSSILTGVFELENYYKSSQVGPRFILLLLGIALVILNVLMYTRKGNKIVKMEKKEPEKEEIKEEVVEKKVSLPAPKKEVSNKGSNNKKSSKKNSSKSRRNDNKAAFREEDVIIVKETVGDANYLVPSENTKKGKVWPIAVVFGLLFVLFVLAFIPWEQFGVTFFTDLTKDVQKFELFKFPLFAKLLGSFNAFGTWTVTDLFLPLGLSVLFLAIVYGIRLDDIFDSFVAGAKKALAPALIVILLYTILVLVTYHPFQLVIYKFILGWTKKFNIATTALVGVLCGLFNSDIAYSFQSVVPYYASIFTVSKNYPLAATIFQSMYGLTMLVAPTSLTLMVILSYLNIPYKKWMKTIWKLLLELLIVCLVVFIFKAM